jgi:hypothetical protein
MLAAAAVGGGAAYAGVKGFGVIIMSHRFDDGSIDGASGALGFVRNTPDTSGLIECGSHGWADGSRSMQCFITDPQTDITYLCFSNNPTLVAATDSIKGDSYVFVQFDREGTCTHVFAESGSAWAPK